LVLKFIEEVWQNGKEGETQYIGQREPENGKKGKEPFLLVKETQISAWRRGGQGLTKEGAC